MPGGGGRGPLRVAVGAGLQGGVQVSFHGVEVFLGGGAIFRLSVFLGSIFETAECCGLK